jgi:regulator of cell morphogenesis and NO signaling
MQEFYNKTIREIAVRFPQTTRVFEEFKIDYCCQGNRAFDDACQSAGVSPQIVGGKITEILNKSDEDSEAPERKSASDLADYIVEKHHVFTRNEIERLTPLMEKVCRKHGDSHAELLEVQKSFALLCEELAPHFRKEETILFPYIKHLEMTAKNHLSSPKPPFGTVKNPVRMMMTEHDAAGEILREMRGATGDYIVPEDACPSFRALYFGLEDLEKDLHRHIHLENNVLFPQAIEFEREIFGEDDDTGGAVHTCGQPACT